jgi:hypothetical protein
MESSNIQSGVYAESVFVSECIRRNISVSLPYTHDSSYDAIVDVDGELHKVQIKSSHIVKGMSSYRFYLRKSGIARAYVSSEVDYFALYGQDQGIWWIVPAEALINRDTGSLRTTIY